MKIKDLIQLLSDLPLESNIYLERNGELSDEISLQTITDSCNDVSIVGYFICDSSLVEFSEEVFQ